MTVQTVKDVTDGAMLGGKYRIRRVLGQGGMGVVVEAVHVELEDRVAIKFLTPRALAEPDAVQRFVREAKAAVRLRSEHIARVRDVGLLPGGDPYIVMEYLDGVELRQLLSGPRLAPPALVDLVLQACEGLAEAHSHGIVHRDIKPSNLFVVTQVDGAPHVKVLDFGVSKVPLDDLNLTGTNSWMGTPAYMSPEQMRSTKNVDARSDLWSLAVVLYEGLEGRVPFPGDSLADLCINVTSMPPQPLTDRTPPGLAAVVMKGLAKSPAERYASAADFAEALAPYAETAAEADVIVRRTRRLLDRRSTPASGVPAADRLAAAPPTAARSPRTEHLVDFVPPTPSANLRAEVDADLAAAFDVLKVDSAALANPPPDVVAARVASPSSDAELALGSSEHLSSSGTELDPGASLDGELPEASALRRRSLFGVLSVLATFLLVVAVVLLVVRDRGGRTSSFPDAERAGELRVVEPMGEPAAAPPDASSPDDDASSPDVVAPDAGTASGPLAPVRRTPEPRRRIAPPADAGDFAPVDAAPAAPADAAPAVTPDADPLGRRT